MLIKKGKAEIMTVIEDDEHNLDDEGTRKVLDKAAQDLEKAKEAPGPAGVIKPEDLEN